MDFALEIAVSSDGSRTNATSVLSYTGPCSAKSSSVSTSSAGQRSAAKHVPLHAAYSRFMPGITRTVYPGNAASTWACSKAGTPGKHVLPPASTMLLNSSRRMSMSHARTVRSTSASNPSCPLNRTDAAVCAGSGSTTSPPATMQCGSGGVTPGAFT